MILSQYIRRISTVVNYDESFLQKNKLNILEVLVFILAVVIFTTIILYALLRKKFLKQELTLNKIDESITDLHSREFTLKKILAQEKMAYWRLNTQSDELYFCNTLIEKLSINLDIYKDDKELLSYFIHFNDKQLFEEKLQEISISKKPVHFKHKMINSHNESLNVTHSLYVEPIQKSNSFFIIGIIKFEN